MSSKQYGLIVTLVVVTGLGGGICGALLTYVFIGKHEKVIEAKEFHVVDEEGRTHAELSLLNNRLPVLRLFDKEAKIRVALGVLPNGTPGLAFYDKGGKSRVTIALLSDGSPSLAFYDSDGITARIVLTVLSDGQSRLTFHDKDGKDRGVLSVLPDGSSDLTLYDENAKARVTLTVSSAVSFLSLRDEDGNVIWSVPQTQKKHFIRRRRTRSLYR